VFNLHDPFTCCTFVGNDWVFVAAFHAVSLTHHHFFYNPLTKEVKGKMKYDMGFSNHQNFPQKCFFNPELNEIYVFYRQGQCLIIDGAAIDDEKTDTGVRFHSFYSRDLG